MYSVERAGDQWQYRWAEHAVYMALENLAEHSDGLHGEITINGLQKNGSPNGHIHWARLNLSSTAARKTLTTALNGRDAKTPWHDLLEVLCTRTAREYRQGEPLVDLAQYQIPAGDRHLMAPLLPLNATSFVFGPGGSMKSILALAVGVACTLGHSIPGCQRPSEICNVLYVDWESDADEHADRLQRIARGLGLTQLPAIHYRRQYRPVANDVAELKKLRASVDASLVIYDSAAGACNGELIDAGAVTRTLTAMREIGGTRLLIGHMSAEQADRTEGVSHPFGTRFWENYTRSCWELRAGEETTTDGKTIWRVLGLANTKVNGSRRGASIAVKLIWDELANSIVLDSADINADGFLASHQSLPVRLHAALRHGERSVNQLADALGYASDDKASRGVIDMTLRRMGNVIQTRHAMGRGNEAMWGLSGNPESPTW